MLESVTVGICLFAIVFIAICIHGFFGDLKRHKHR